MDDYPMAADSEWPEAWIMSDGENGARHSGDDVSSSPPPPVFDQCQPNRCEPNVAVSAAELRAVGVSYWQLDGNTAACPYPVRAVPYHPEAEAANADPKLAALRDRRGYSYAYVNDDERKEKLRCGMPIYGSCNHRILLDSQYRTLSHRFLRLTSSQ